MSEAATPEVAWGDVSETLRPFIAARVATPADTDDVLQEVLLRLHRGASSVRDDRRFSGWMHQVARRAVADHHRARGRHPFPRPDVGSDPAARVASFAPPSVGDVDPAEALASVLRPMVALLPSPYREAITWTELEGLSQVEAAARAGVTQAAMKSRVQRGRAKLRVLIERCCRLALDARGHVIDCEPRARGC